MKTYIRSSKRLGMQELRSLSRYGWRENELSKLNSFASRLGADVEDIGNGYIRISRYGENLGTFSVYNQHQAICYNAGGINNVMETYADNINEAIGRATDILTRE